MPDWLRHQFDLKRIPGIDSRKSRVQYRVSLRRRIDSMSHAGEESHGLIDRLRRPHYAQPNLLVSARLALAVGTVSGQSCSGIFALLLRREGQTRLAQVVTLQAR